MNPGSVFDASAPKEPPRNVMAAVEFQQSLDGPLITHLVKFQCMLNAHAPNPKAMSLLTTIQNQLKVPPRCTVKPGVAHKVVPITSSSPIHGD